MRLVVTEKNDAAQKIADLLGATKPKADKVYSTPVYRFTVDGCLLYTSDAADEL